MGRRWVGAAMVMVLLAGVPGCRRDDGAAEPRVVIGVGSTTEQRVLAALTARVLDGAGMTPELRADLGGTVGLRRAAIGGDIDVFWDYTGAAWALGMGQQAPPADPQDSFERVREADEANGLRWLAPSTANATLALFVRRRDLPADDRPRGLAWLAGVLSAGGQRLCADPEFITREGGLEALAAAYAMDLERVTRAAVPAAEDAAVSQVAGGRCFAGLATATSGRAPRAGLVPVDDTLSVFPAFVVAPVARAERLPALPGLPEALAEVTRVLDTAALARMNARAEAGNDPGEIAEDFLAGNS